MNEKIKCIKNNCSACQEWLKEKLASCEDWEVKRKESYQRFELRFCPNVGNDKENNTTVIEPTKQEWYVETGGYSYLPCPDGCGKSGIKKNDFGDQTILDHDCLSSQVKSSQVKSSQQSTSGSDLENNPQKTNYLPYILGGIGAIGLIGIITCFLLKNKKGGKE